MSESNAPQMDPAFPDQAPSPDESAGAPRGFGLGSNGPFDLGKRSWTDDRDDSSATVYIALITAVAILSLVAVIAGASGSPQFSIGLGLGAGVGVIPIVIIAVFRALSPSTNGDGTRRRRMTQEEWQRVFGSTAGSGWTGNTSQPGDEPRSPFSDAEDGVATALQRAYELLELAPEAGMRDIRTSYHRLAHRHHPDKAAWRSEEVRALAEQRMKKLNAAYALIRESRRRVPA